MIDKLREIAANAGQLAQTYAALSDEHTRLYQAGQNEGDAATVRAIARDLQQLAPRLREMADLADNMQVTSDAAFEAVDAELAEIRSVADDKISDVSAFAADLADEAEADAEDLIAWADDAEEGSEP